MDHQFIYGIVLLVGIFLVLQAWYRYRDKRRHLDVMIKRFKDNPHEIDLSLSTMEQILDEIKKRGQPIVVLHPIWNKNKPQSTPFQAIVCGMNPATAVVVMQGACYSIATGKPIQANEDEE